MEDVPHGAHAGLPGSASSTLRFEADDLVERSRSRIPKGLERREVIPSLALAALFVGSASACATLLTSDRVLHPLTAALLVVLYALASRIDFELGGGSAVPTQVVFVPMLFLLPSHLVPLFVGAGFALGNLVDHVRGARHVQRVVAVLACSMHSLGPAVVLSLGGDPSPSWHIWPLLLGALAAQFAIDSVTSVVHEWTCNGVPPGMQLRFMGTVYLVDGALAPVGLMAAAATDELPYAFVGVLALVGLLSVFARERRRRIDHAIELGHAYRGTAFLLGDVVEAEDAYTGSHSKDVVELALAVADALRLSAHERRLTEFTALLHDVGKIRIADHIVNKPGPLAPDEWRLMRTHTVEGQRLLERVGGLLGEVGHLVRSCHERWDGKGYPDGLLADEIPLASRIVCCCDAFAAMVTTRPYRKALSFDEARAELRAGAGTQFDPVIVKALLSVVDARAQEAGALPSLRPAA
jgi:HD-GYP domain-containing protein (c-di-GMP phosphodiesterase class II)